MTFEQVNGRSEETSSKTNSPSSFKRYLWETTKKFRLSGLDEKEICWEDLESFNQGSQTKRENDSDPDLKKAARGKGILQLESFVEGKPHRRS